MEKQAQDLMAVMPAELQALVRKHLSMTQALRIQDKSRTVSP